MFGKCRGCEANRSEIEWLRAENSRLVKIIAEIQKPGIVKVVDPPPPRPNFRPREASAPRGPVVFPGNEPDPERDFEVGEA